MSVSKSPKRARAKAQGYRSGLEEEVARQLRSHNIPFQYEEYKIPFVQPAKKRTYKPDFILPNGIIIETKGRFITADRQKHRMIFEQHPALDIRFVFNNPNTRIAKGSKTTYAMWCAKYGFFFAKKLIPSEWLEEAPQDERIEAAIAILEGWKPPA